MYKQEKQKEKLTHSEVGSLPGFSLITGRIFLVKYSWRIDIFLGLAQRAGELSQTRDDSLHSATLTETQDIFLPRLRPVHLKFYRCSSFTSSLKEHKTLKNTQF